MPTVAELERLQALLARLEPLARKQRGQLIEAADWNALVDSLLEVTRIAAAFDTTTAVPPHDHPDQVAVGWLDPRLRQLVTGGGLADPAAEGELGKLRRDLGRIVTRIDDVDVRIADVRSRVTEVATKDLAREADLTRVARRVDGIGDARVDVTDLRSTLRTLEVDVQRAVEVGSRLEVDGQPLDVAALVRRIDAADDLRQRLTAANGELLDASVFERRVSELETSLVTESELDAAIGGLRGIQPGDRAELLEGARRAALEAIEGRADNLGADLRGQIDRRFGEIAPAVDAAVGRATEDVATQVLSAARAEISTAVAAANAGLRAELTADVDRRFSTINSSVDARISAAFDGLPGRVRDELDVRLPRELDPLTTRLEAAEEVGTGLAGRVDALSLSQQASADQLATGLRDEGLAHAQLRVDLTDRIDGVESNIDPKLADQAAALREGLRTDLQGDIAAGRRDLEASLAAVAREAAATEVRVLSTRLESEVRVAVRQELDVTRVELERAIDARVLANETRIAGLVDNEVRRATANVQSLVRQEFDAFRPELVRVVDERIVTRPREGPVIGDQPIDVNRSPRPGG